MHCRGGSGAAGGATGGASPELRAAIWRALQSGGGRGVEPAAIAAQCGELAPAADVRRALEDMEADVSIYQKDGRYFVL